MSPEQLKAELDRRFPGFTEACEVAARQGGNGVVVYYRQFNNSPEDIKTLGMAMRYAGLRQVLIWQSWWALPGNDQLVTSTQNAEKLLPVSAFPSLN